MRTKDSILLEQAYAKVLEANELALSRPKMSNPLKDQFELHIQYIDQAEDDADKPKIQSIVLGHKQGEELHSLDAVSFAVQEEAEKLDRAGKFWIRVFVSKVHNPNGSIAQLTDISNVLTLIQNNKGKHILWRCYGPGPKKEGTVHIRGQFANYSETLKAFRTASHTLEDQYPRDQYE